MRYTRIWSHRPYSPSVVSVVIEASVQGFSKILPESAIESSYSYWKDGQTEYYYPEAELRKTAQFLNEEIMRNPYRVFAFFRESLQKGKLLNAFSEKYAGKELSGIGSDELIGHMDEFHKRFFETYSYAASLIIMGYQQDTPLYNRMMEILREKTAREPEKFADYLLALTRSPYRLKTQAQEKRVLEIARKAKEKVIDGASEIRREFGEELQRMAADFEWLSYDYSNLVGWDIDHYAKLVEEKLGAKIEEEIALLDDYERMVSEEFTRVCRLLKLSVEEISVFDHVRNMGYYKWAREHEFQQATRNNMEVQVEIGRRAGLTSLESMYLFMEEMENVMEDPGKFKGMAKERIACSLLIVERSGKSIILGKEAKEEFSKCEFATDEIDAKATKLRGMPACPGKANGKVKIINVMADMVKMEKGDILVSAATSPDLVPAMKKAAAIITNEGGIMCHAAIVSRELNIPCIVGVKNANKILKDGDVVEVDAARGIIRKI
ncbi:MAG: PEP-utilizing enzyme [Candidatus Micrarchaeota archaeon]